MFGEMNPKINYKTKNSYFPIINLKTKSKRYLSPPKILSPPSRYLFTALPSSWLILLLQPQPTWTLHISLSLLPLYPGLLHSSLPLGGCYSFVNSNPLSPLSLSVPNIDCCSISVTTVAPSLLNLATAPAALCFVSATISARWY